MHNHNKTFRDAAHTVLFGGILFVIFHILIP